MVRNLMLLKARVNEGMYIFGQDKKDIFKSLWQGFCPRVFEVLKLIRSKLYEKVNDLSI